MLPAGLDPVAYAGLVLTQVGFNCGSRSPVTPGSTAVVIGDGLVGQWAGQTLVQRGARVVMVGRHPDRLARFSRHGDTVLAREDLGVAGDVTTDALIDRDGRMAELSPETIQRLDRVLPSTWSRGNPVDIMSDARADRYGEALEILLQDRQVDAVLVLSCPVAVVSGSDAAAAVRPIL